MKFDLAYEALCSLREDYSRALVELCSISTQPSATEGAKLMVALYRAKLKHDMTKESYLKFLSFMQSKFPGQLANSGFKVST